MTSTAYAATTVRFQVEGMDCPSCAAKIEQAVGQVPGVGGSRVNYSTGVLLVDATAAVDPAAVIRATAAVGHPATLVVAAPPGRHEWTIEGMDCADCARKIDTAVARLPGVGDVAINLGTGRLRLTLDDGLTAPGEIVRTVRALGYTARTPSAALAPPTPWYRTAKGRLVLVSGTLVALAFALSFVLPRFSYGAYAVATLIAAWPVVRKAWGPRARGARSTSTPSSPSPRSAR